MFKDFEGKTESEALQKARQELGLVNDDVYVEVLEETKKGLFKRSYVKIRVYYGEEEKEDIEKASNAEDIPEKGEKLTAESDVERKTIEFISTLIRKMGYEADITITSRRDSKICLNIESDNSSILIGRKGKNLDAIQLLANTWSTECARVMGACRERPAQTSFDAGVASVSRVLVAFMLVMCPIVFLLNGLTKGDWLSALLFSVSVAVGITPQMLPVFVTTCLARGAREMARHEVIVKDLAAIQNLGAMDVLCCDKTGTLTEDRVILERHINVEGHPDDRVLRHA